MRGRRGLAAGAAMGALALAGCGTAIKGGAATGGDGTPARVTTTAAAKGDLDGFTWNLPAGEPFSVDPIKSFNYSENTIVANMCDSLLRLTPGFAIKPGLATSYSHPSPTTWVYQLRKGVRFWDGRPLTAEDAAYSLQRNMDPKAGSFWGYYFRNVKRIAATGPLQVTVTLTRPDHLFHEMLATAAGAVSEKRFTQAAGKDYGTPQKGVMCTGPFKFANWSSGESIRLVRNDAYWDPALKAHSSSVDFKFITDESTAVGALVSGELDGEYFYLPPAGLDRLQQSTTGHLSLGKSTAFFTLIPTATKGPFADPKVRQALLDATDRSAIAKTVLQGTAEPARVLSGPDTWSYAANVFKAGYDHVPAPAVNLTQAKQLLGQAGHPKGKIVLAAQGSSAVHEQIASVLQAAGREIGLDIQIKTIPVEQFGGFYADPKLRASVDGFLSTWYGNVADPLDTYVFLSPSGESAYNGYRSTAANDAVRSALAASGDAQRADHTVAAQATMTKDAVWLPLEYLSNILYMSDRVTGAPASIAYLYFPWAAQVGAP
jgi:peptide/nickel transport system substrate-binding protein